jgi:hypothetical protein
MGKLNSGKSQLMKYTKSNQIPMFLVLYSLLTVGLLNSTNALASDISGVNESSLLVAGSLRSRVERVFFNGEIEQVIPQQKDSKSDKWYVGNLLPSPSQRMVAFNRATDEDLWIYEIEKRTEKRQTTIGKRATGKYSSVGVTARRWSADGKRILFEVIAGETEDPEGGRPDLVVRPAPYGFHIYNLETGKTTPLPPSIDGKLIVAWLKNGDFILSFPTTGWDDNSKRGGRLVLYSDADNRSPIVLAELPAGSEFHQVTLSPDELWLAFNETSWKNQTSQLQKLNVNTKAIEPVTPVGGFAEYQWPKYSRGGTRISYQHQKSPDELVVDGVTVFSGKFRQAEWIGDTRLAVEWFDSSAKKRFLTVVDSTKAKAISEHEVER